MIGTDIQYAAKLLKNNELVAIPTETVYGLAANALNDDAILKIFITKNRPTFDPLIVHFRTIEEIKKYVISFPSKAKLLATTFMPGPLTLLLPKNHLISDLVTSGLPYVAIRIPSHSTSLELLNCLDFPLAAPSANPFGYVSPTTAQHVEAQLGDKIPYILDGGPCEIGIESTIVGFDTDLPTVYRLGGTSIEQIEAVIGKVNVQLHSSSNPKSAGMLKSHYAPNKTVILGNLETLIQQYPPETTGVLSFCKNYNYPYQVILSPDGNLKEAARNLFDGLRFLDSLPVTTILTEPVPDQNLGRAINDRLKRASATEKEEEPD